MLMVRTHNHAHVLIVTIECFYSIGSTSFDPYMTEPNPDVPTVEFEIEVRFSVELHDSANFLS